MAKRQPLGRTDGLDVARLRVQQLQDLLQEVERLWERRLVRVVVSASAIALAHWLGLDVGIARQLLGA